MERIPIFRVKEVEPVAENFLMMIVLDLESQVGVPRTEAFFEYLQDVVIHGREV